MRKAVWRGSSADAAEFADALCKLLVYERLLYVINRSGAHGPHSCCDASPQCQENGWCIWLSRTQSLKQLHTVHVGQAYFCYEATRLKIIDSSKTGLRVFKAVRLTAEYAHQRGDTVPYRRIGIHNKYYELTFGYVDGCIHLIALRFALNAGLPRGIRLLAGDR